jgi:hypothetical protein
MVFGLLEITSTTGKQVQVCLDRRCQWCFGHESGIHEHAFIVWIGEAELWSNIRFVPQFSKLSVLRTGENKNLHLIDVYKGKSAAAMAPLNTYGVVISDCRAWLI